MLDLHAILIDLFIVVYCALLHLLEIHRYCMSVSYKLVVQIRYYYNAIL